MVESKAHTVAAYLGRMDVGKSCVRFRVLDDLPLALVAEVIARTSIDPFIDMCERSRGEERA